MTLWNSSLMINESECEGRVEITQLIPTTESNVLILKKKLKSNQLNLFPSKGSVGHFCSCKGDYNS